jgi:AraC-like DNA-binding protein
MAEPREIPDLPQRLTSLLERCTHVFGLNLVFKPAIPDMRLPASHEQHRTPPCMAFKKRNGSEPCIRHDILETPAEIHGKPRGRIHTCPAGFTEIAVPVTSEGAQLGVLFAGPCWTRPGRKPHRWLPRIKDPEYLADRRELLRALAGRIAQIYSGQMDSGARPGDADDRRSVINHFLEAHLAEALTIGDLAEELSLSASRASHVVRQVTGQSFSTLLRRTRLRHGAHLLIATDLPIGEVAWRCGLADQSYFSRLFKREYRSTPRAYRKVHRRVE